MASFWQWKGEGKSREKRKDKHTYSITTTTDTGGDIITHFQVNAEDKDEAALMGAIEGSRENKKR